jgi:hypothetical protein
VDNGGTRFRHTGRHWTCDVLSRWQMLQTCAAADGACTIEHYNYEKC